MKDVNTRIYIIFTYLSIENLASWKPKFSLLMDTHVESVKVTMSPYLTILIFSQLMLDL